MVLLVFEVSRVLFLLCFNALYMDMLSMLEVS